MMIHTRKTWWPEQRRQSVSRCVPVRRGLSIMEVLFAIGVLTIGLMGVAFILPVATNNAATALRDDRAVEEVNNRVATDLAHLSKNVTHMTRAENASVTPAHFGVVPRQGFNLTEQRFVDVSLDQLPRAFVIDPWFLTAANNLRPNGSTNAANGYDRTLFPCYDRNYVPVISPSERISTSLGFTWTTPVNGRTVQWNSPRFVRMGLPGFRPNFAPGFAASRGGATSGDDLSVVVADDSTRGAGLFVQRSANAMRSLTKPTVTGRFSSIVMMSRSATGSNIYNASVVTMQDRQLVTVPGGGTLQHQLTPYTAAAADASNVPDDQLTYPGEVLGYVVEAPKIFRNGGGGEFIFRCSAATRPNVKEGGWLCLMRQEYRGEPAAGSARSLLNTAMAQSNVFDSNPDGPLHYAWYQITDVVAGPALDSGSFRTQVAVRGPDWVFHPRQVEQRYSSGASLYMAPYSISNPPPAPLSGARPNYDVDQQPNNAFSIADVLAPDFGTYVVVMPDVISVEQFPFKFE